MGRQEKVVVIYTCDECGQEVENKDYDLDSKILCSTCGSKLLNKLVKEGYTISLAGGFKCTFSVVQF